MMKTIWTETPKGEEAQQEWIGSQSRHRLPMVQITKNGCLKINMWVVILNAKGNEFPRTGITNLPHLFFYTTNHDKPQ